MNKRLRRGMLLVTLVAALVAPEGAFALGADGTGGPAVEFRGGERDAWEPLLARGRDAGLDPARLETTAARLSQAGVTADAAAAVLEPAFGAGRAGLPVGAVLDKVEEGAAKGADAATLAQAAQTRLESLQAAQQLLGEQGYTEPADRGRGLLVATALALESGVSAATLAPALELGRSRPPGQVKAVVEAGESLHLDGVEPTAVAALLVDCLERDLRRPEILRVVRFAAERQRSGANGSELRTALWGDGGSGRLGGPAGGYGRGSGPGGGSGAGVGGPGGGPPHGTGPPRGGQR